MFHLLTQLNRYRQKCVYSQKDRIDGDCQTRALITLIPSYPSGSSIVKWGYVPGDGRPEVGGDHTAGGVVSVRQGVEVRGRIGDKQHQHQQWWFVCIQRPPSLLTTLDPPVYCTSPSSIGRPTSRAVWAGLTQGGPEPRAMSSQPSVQPKEASNSAC